MTTQLDAEKKYIEERWKDQVNWLDKKSSFYKKRYQYCKVLEIVFAALIPFFAVLDETSFAKELHINLLVAALGVALTIIAGMLMLYKYHELWIQYRTTAEALKVEKFLFDTKSGDYETKDAFKIFVVKVESILANENARWNELIKREPEVQNGNSPTDTADQAL